MEGFFDDKWKLCDKLPNNALHTDAKSRQRENISQEDEMKFGVKKMLIDSAGELDRWAVKI